MFIRCWGSRGSIPVAGPEYIKYGGDTTCLEIRAQSGEIVVVDAGTGIRRLGRLLAREDHRELHMLFTHVHWDHILGFPFFRPLYQKKVTIWMHRCPFHGSFIQKALSDLMTTPYFPVPYSGIVAKMVYENACPQTFRIGSLTIEPIALNHPNGGSGYKFCEGSHSFVFLTDNELGHTHPDGLPPKDYRAFCTDTDLLIHDAEFTPAEYPAVKGWGHSNTRDVLDLALGAGVARLGLFHINQDRTDAKMDALVDEMAQVIKKQNRRLQCFGVAADWSLNL